MSITKSDAMQPVAICRHDAAQGPGHLIDFFDAHAIPWRLFAVDAGETPPTRAGDYSGVVILGSPASVNDGLSWMRREEALLRDALRLERPILGHCFGGQLLAKTLGARVRRNSVPHIGWGRVLVTRFDEAAEWFGARRELELFHWHFDTFEIPRGAKRVLFGSYCMNKGFAIGPHLGLQSHLEVTADSVRLWCRNDGDEIRRNVSASVQSEAEILTNLDARVTALHRLADRVYGRWAQHLPGWHRIVVPVRPHTRPRGGESWGERLMHA
ncbi:type 1 glutamine amidotransferase [Jeongeupia sp. USM3]|uniref:type 1 glutamine amidotransferase n=1 Tax=Jeongeupia sp. USM3 TaxID=1906741 RepID=UPI0009F52340|nr:type 1 glutamine amidotransferase [Jeongeupia sp. USM3]